MAQPNGTTTPTPPTQARYPWRATLRTVLAAGIAAASLAPVIAGTAHLETVPAVAQLLVVCATVTRILAIPGVNAWLARFVPFLAAAPKAASQPTTVA